MSDITLRYLLFGEDRSASKTVDSVGQAANKTAGHVQKFAEVAAAGLAGAAAASVKMAADYQEQMTALVTGAGESEQNIKMVSNGLLKMAGQVGVSADQLAKGMYMVESAGFHGASGLKVMKAAAEGAKVGGADMETVANAVTSALNAYGKTGKDAANVTSQLVATVASGKMHMEDLAGSLGTVLPAAAKLHIPLSQVNGAIATMTAQGTDASNAATYLKQTIANLAAPSAGSAKALESIGLSANDVSGMIGKGNLLGALQLINDHLEKKFPEGGAAALSTLKNISGGAKTMQGVLELTGTSMKTWTDNAKAIGSASAETGGHVQGWSKVQEDFNTKLHEAIAQVQSMAIQVGTALLPVVTRIANFLSADMIPALSTMAHWIQQNQEWLMPLVAVLGSGALALVAVAKAVALWRDAQAALNVVLDANPIGLVIAAVAALTAGLVVAYEKSKTFRDIVNGAFSAVGDAASAMWNDAIRPALKFMADAWLTVVGGIVDGAANAFGWVPGIGGKLKGAAKAFDSFRDDVNTALGGIKDHVDTVVNATMNLRATTTDATGTHITTVKAQLAGGGPANAGSMYLVGEQGPELFVPHTSGTVVPANTTASVLSGGGGGGDTYYIQVSTGPMTTEGARELDRALRALSRQTGGALGYA